MSSFVAFRSRRISLVERSRSSFALVVSCLCAGENLLPPSDSVDEGCQWEVQTDDRPMRAGFPTGTHRRRSSEEAHSLLGQRVCA
jgi:hypothetical protein